MQTTPSRIWIWVADSVSYNNNDYVKCASLYTNNGEKKKQVWQKAMVAKF